MNLAFGNKIIYDDADFSINQYDKAGIVGINGAGKTTLFRILLGEQELDSGSIMAGNLRMGYLPQEIVIEEETCTVLDYLQEGRPVGQAGRRTEPGLPETGDRGGFRADQPVKTDGTAAVALRVL